MVKKNEKNSRLWQKIVENIKVLPNSTKSVSQALHQNDQMTCHEKPLTKKRIPKMLRRIQEFRLVNKTIYIGWIEKIKM